MFLLIQDGKYTVSRIASPSSAIEADVKIGDEIIAISGTPISQMTIEEISNIAKAMNTLGTEIELTFLTTQKKATYCQTHFAKINILRYAPEVLNPRLEKTSVFQTRHSVYGLPLLRTCSGIRRGVGGEVKTLALWGSGYFQYPLREVS